MLTARACACRIAQLPQLFRVGMEAKVRSVYLLPRVGACSIVASQWQQHQRQEEEKEDLEQRDQEEEDGHAVVSYDDFLEYLQRMPSLHVPARPRANMLHLPFDGKNAVVFSS